MPPIISVLLPVYNGALTIESAVQSVLTQTVEHFELLVLDDGSTDDTGPIVAELATSDKRLRLITLNHVGLTKTLNRGLTLARGKFVARQDADDISLPSRFAKQLPYLKTMKYGACCTRAFDYKLSRPVPRRFWLIPPRQLLLPYMNFHIHGTLMIRKDILKQIGGYDETFTYAQDYKLFYDLSKNNVPVKYLSDVLYHLGHSKTSITLTHRSEQLQNARRVRKLYRRL